MAYFGKQFVLSSQENFDDFLNTIATDLPEKAKQAILNQKATLKLEKNDDDQYTITTAKPDGSLREVTFTCGVPFEDELAGRTATTTVSVKGDEVVTVMKFDDDRVLSLTREFSDNQVVVSIRATGYDGVAKRIYKA